MSKFFPEDDDQGEFPPPSSSLESSLGNKLSHKEHQEVRRIVVAITYIACFQPEELRLDVDKHLKASCLLALMETGLGPLHWLLEACAAQGVEPKVLLETIQSGPIKESGKLLAGFLIWTKREKQVTWKFSQLIDDAVLTDLAVKKHPLFTWTMTYLARVTESDREVLDDLISLRNIRAQQNQGQMIADAFLQYYNQPKAGDAETAKGKEFDEFLQNYSASHHQFGPRSRRRP